MITSSSNSTFKELMKLKQKKYRDTHYLVEGDHLVEDAIANNCCDLIITSDEGFESEIPVFMITEELMKKLAFTKSPQKIMARVKKDNSSELVEGNRYLLLDDLQDPGNIGTLVRTALALGIDQVIMSPNTVDLYNDKMLRSMQGAHFKMPILIRDLSDVIGQLRSQGVKVIGSALEGGKPLDQLEKSLKMAYIVGNEGNGMNPEILALCDEIGYIEIEKIESLNVAIAGSIMMYHFK